ncbi:hypothetical protein NSK_006587 [Nannochloropsis salina CCMP1776]|uniref:Uncharacterized protein n=1 Tax=Nannochloropsis salina CCMP1776 TaxID=1027361 RepID=A0A4D9CZJ4_9STRA|nr:hypothetical protein NSK_006587 [Nannochloropsis salina CCMP1776]|eukprot:TFJ81919.1 hypothetical protein NSK_006587 [Nannochloropsis salina CCMP1776]
MRDMTQSVADAFPVQRPGTAEGGEVGDIGEGVYYQEEELLVMSPEWARHFRERFRARKAGAKRGKRTREIVRWSHREVDALPPPTARALGKRASSKRNGHVGREEGEEDEADERREEEEEEQAAIGPDGERRKALRLEKLPLCLRESVMGFMEEDGEVQGGKKG